MNGPSRRSQPTPGPAGAGRVWAALGRSAFAERRARRRRVVGRGLRRRHAGDPAARRRGGDDPLVPAGVEGLAQLVEHGEHPVGIGAATDDVVEHLAQVGAGLGRGVAAGVGDRQAHGAAVAVGRLADDEPALDEPVDQRRQRRLGDGQAGGQLRGPLVAGRQQPEHAVLGERQLARCRGSRGPGRAGRWSGWAGQRACRGSRAGLELFGSRTVTLPRSAAGGRSQRTVPMVTGQQTSVVVADR